MMMTIKTWGAVFGWALVCALTGPLWVGGFSLALVLRGLGAILRWCFWEPTQAVWMQLVGAYRRASARSAPAVADDLERQRRARGLIGRARRIGRRR